MDGQPVICVWCLFHSLCRLSAGAALYMQIFKSLFSSSLQLMLLLL